MEYQKGHTFTIPLVSKKILLTQGRFPWHENYEGHLQEKKKF
jgi:hypothetical protein